MCIKMIGKIFNKTKTNYNWLVDLIVHFKIMLISFFRVSEFPVSFSYHFYKWKIISFYFLPKRAYLPFKVQIKHCLPQEASQIALTWPSLCSHGLYTATGV